MATCKLNKLQRDKLQSLINDYDGACSELLSFLTDIQEDWEAEMEEKSDKWKEGGAGQEAQERLDTLNAWIDELPDEISINPDQV